MKKLWGIVAALLLWLPGAALAAAPLDAADFVFSYQGVAYRLGEPAAALVAAIEADMGPMERLEVDSCLFQGKDKELSNEELLLGTYPIGPKGEDQLETVMVLGGDHQTSRAIGIGMSRTQVEEAYGMEYRLEYDELMYQAERLPTKPVLVFLLDLETDTVSGFYLMRNSS